MLTKHPHADSFWQSKRLIRIHMTGRPPAASGLSKSGTDPLRGNGTRFWLEISGSKPHKSDSGLKKQRVMGRSHLRVLLVLEVLVDGGVEVLGVALVQTVDLALGLDLHVPLSQDELANGL